MAPRYTALVRGPAPLVATDSWWVIPLWYAALIAVAARFGGMPRWYLPAAGGGLVLAAVTMAAVLHTLRSNALAVTGQGLLLGLRGGARRRLGRRRRQLAVPWGDVSELVIAPRLHGSRLEIRLRPGVPAARQPAPWAEILAVVISLVLPLAYFVRTPGLLRVSRRSARLRVRLQAATADEVAAAVRELAGPAQVPVTVGAHRWWHGRAGRSGRAPWSPGPAAPVGPAPQVMA